MNNGTQESKISLMDFAFSIGQQLLKTRFLHILTYCVGIL